MKTAPPQDITALLGMQTPGARALVAVYLVAISVITVEIRAGMSAFWPALASLGVLVAATAALLLVPGDPLPPRATAALIAHGPIASALVLAVLPVPLLTPIQGWTHGGATTVYCFLCVRGRAGSAWIGLSATIATYTAWAAIVGLGPLTGLAMTVIDIGPVAMATVLSFTLRPDARETFALREAATRRIADRAAADAALAERDEQLGRLDRLARPLLARIATGEPLTGTEKSRCELLEAHLRDRLRAPALTDPATTDSVRAARRRGVEVVLIDDHGMDGIDAHGERAFRAAVAAALDSAEDGAVSVRILPPGRTTMASILVRTSHTTVRTEFDHDGAPVSAEPASAVRPAQAAG